MNVQSSIENKLQQALQPLHMQVINESHQHAGPATESHFKVVLVTAAFEGVSRIQRHRQVNQYLSQELQQGLHALSLKLYTPSEWQARQGDVPASPACRGGSKAQAEPA